MSGVVQGSTGGQGRLDVNVHSEWRPQYIVHIKLYPMLVNPSCLHRHLQHVTIDKQLNGWRQSTS